MRKALILKLQLRKVQLSIFQIVAHSCLIVFSWCLFIYLAFTAIEIEEHHFSKLGFLLFLASIAFSLGLTSFLFYLRGESNKHYSFDVEYKTTQLKPETSTKVTTKFIEIKN